MKYVLAIMIILAISGCIYVNKVEVNNATGIKLPETHPALTLPNYNQRTPK